MHKFLHIYALFIKAISIDDYINGVGNTISLDIFECDKGNNYKDT